ncbi:MAG: transporter substrate-binding domain-containing protein [Smithellaceae bacterium]
MEPLRLLPLNLTPEEISFIKIHPEVRLGVDPRFVPFEFIDSDGKYKGIAADYIGLISQAAGIKMTVAMGLTWTEAYDMALDRKIDVLPANRQDSRKRKAFSSSPNRIITSKESS